MARHRFGKGVGDLQLWVAGRRRFAKRAAHCPPDGRKETVYRGNPVVGFRADSAAVIHTTIQALWDSEATVRYGPDGVLLTSNAPSRVLESSFKVKVIGAPSSPSHVKKEGSSAEQTTPVFATIDSGVPDLGTAIEKAQEETKEAPEREHSAAPARRSRARIPEGCEGELPNFWWIHLPEELWQKDGCCRLCMGRTGIKGKCPIDDDHLVSDRRI